MNNMLKISPVEWMEPTHLFVTELNPSLVQVAIYNDDSVTIWQV
jgi:hypothetical protein